MAVKISSPSISSMNKKQVLVFNNYNLISTDGGPSGNLAQNFVGFSSEYFFLNKRIIRKKRNRIGLIMGRLFNSRHSSYVEANLQKTDNLNEWLLESQIIFRNINAESYKFLLFHDVWNLGACLPLIKANQIVILHPVCPELPSEETAFQKKLFSERDVAWTIEAEKKAFERANILFFVNDGAKCIYEKLIKNSSTIYYIKYGAKRVTDLRIYPLDRGKINLFYFGRRIPIKGFDIIVEAFKKAVTVRDDLNLIIAGNGEKVEGKNIYDIGFTTTPHYWINSVDYVINCNRQSYYDMSVLETLSIGTPIIISTNFGHTAFKSYSSKGIIDIGEPSVENLVKIFLSRELIKKELGFGVQENRAIFERDLSNVTYINNLNALLKSITAKYS